MNTASTGATNRYIKGRRASHEVKNKGLIETSNINDTNKGFRARASVKPLSHLSMIERNIRRYHSKKKTRQNQSLNRQYNQTTSPTETQEPLSMSFGRKHYAEINELTAVRVKRQDAASTSNSTPYDKHHLPSISHTCETPAHGMTISNDILLRRGNIKERLSKNLVAQGESIDAATNVGQFKTPAT